MGHLINPIAFRIGQTTGWVDTWFSTNDVYPEFLHFVLKIRLFLNYQLSSMPLLDDVNLKKKGGNNLFKSAILYSHFRIVFNLTSVFISLFVYPGKFWDSFFRYKRYNRRFSHMFYRRHYLQDKSLSGDLPDLYKAFPYRLKNILDQDDNYSNMDIDSKSWSNLFVLRNGRVDI